MLRVLKTGLVVSALAAWLGRGAGCDREDQQERERRGGTPAPEQQRPETTPPPQDRETVPPAPHEEPAPDPPARP